MTPTCGRSRRRRPAGRRRGRAPCRRRRGGSPRGSRRSSSCPRRSARAGRRSRPRRSRGRCRRARRDRRSASRARGSRPRSPFIALHAVLQLGPARRRSCRAPPSAVRASSVIGTSASAARLSRHEAPRSRSRPRAPRRSRPSARWIAAISSAVMSGAPIRSSSARPSASAARRGRGDERRELALAQVVADGLAGERRGRRTPTSRSSRIWNASPSGRPNADSGAAQLVEPSRERGAEVQRALDGVLAALVPLDAARHAGVADARGRRREVEVLADAQLDAQLVVDRRAGASRPSASMSA